MDLSDWLAAIKDGGRAAKIDLKEGHLVIDGVLEATERVGMPDDDIWLNAAVEIPGGLSGFARLRDARPAARISCPMDTLASYLTVVPEAFLVVEALRMSGVSWLCFGACVPGVERLVHEMHERGWPINVWDVENRDDFERALALHPDAITADLASIEHRPQVGGR